MVTVGIAELKAELSKYIRIAKNGESVQIEDRGIPAAMLTPIAKNPSLNELVRKPVAKTGRPFNNRVKLEDSIKLDIVEELLKDRYK